MDKVPPQLARKRYSVDSDDSSEDDGSLVIMQPTKQEQQSVKKQPPNEINKQPTTVVLKKTISTLPMDFSDSDSEDDLLLSGKATFAKKTTSGTARASGKPAKAASTSSVSSRSQASSSNANSAAAKQSRDEARARKKRETEERKQQDKLARVTKREEDKLERERLKLEDKQTKKRQLEQAQARDGKFAHEEIVVLMDPIVYNNDEYALETVLSDDFLLKSYPSALTCTKSVQWVRKDHLQGGADDALKHLENNDRNHFEHLQYLMLILEPEDFNPLLQRDTDADEDDDYPKLEQWLALLKSRWKYVWETSKEPRILLLLHRIPEALDRLWVDHRRHKRNNGAPSPPTAYEMEDAIQWLLIQFQVECVHCPSIESIQANVHKQTRGLCEAPYVNPVSEIQCIKKIKQGADAKGPALTRAKDVWLRQLQQMPRLSEPMARNVVRHYPTMQSLWQAYQQGDEDTNRMLVAGILSETSRQAKLSDSLYRFMTSNNPKDMLL